ncbi:DUF4296 domain-containing protein [Hymenobacter lutimineralis]|uniref:DUF4296 domain-containing protein n=1 Tax=Hymenobacter lutimineralis TaxID=2606448 RepID=A0A5D6VFF9_9BACT|nr:MULTISPECIES: DUF4296 domain-containing protein [Hymenobacter]QIX60364.1 DUF4296 domain-containing protein [Hymenobacter sp. BT18]TYZ14216.1 DUF4296 domain-containing protein [Hymenobacter lutimineralis]
MKLISACAGVALTLLAACQRPEEIAPPTPLVPKPEMAHLLTEIHLAEVRVDASRLTSDSAQALFLQYKDSLLRRQGVSDSAFAKSYRYYTIHDKDLEEVYKLVLDSLEVRRARYGPLSAPNQASPAYRRR